MTRRPDLPSGRARISIVGVIGEILITAGVFVFLFLGWQLWLNDIVVGNEQRDDAIAFSRELGSAAPPAAPLDPDSNFGEPVVSPASAETVAFANIYIPRFGDDYVRTVAEGVSASNVLRTGVGHYPGTQMPGEVGNFAVAAHRTTYGAPFNRIAELTVGDRIYVQTSDGWYTYVFRSLEYVLPSAIEVLEPVPHAPGMAANDRIITLTSCNPMLSAAERIIAYGVFEEWQPGSAGPPEELANLNLAGA
ncbi:sortase A [Marisediminicola sp. UYEF4]|uniref:class E sortase n=1 Tax=Marisediminicola sp. UYEF4 TaxID=1756384 RepID=UPI003399AD48